MEKADTVLKNGKVHTVDENMSQAEAVAIAGGKILAVGSNAVIEKFVGDKTEGGLRCRSTRGSSKRCSSG